MKQFKLWNRLISLFRQEIKGFTNEAESLKKELKIKFSEEFSGGLGRCNKMRTKFGLKGIYSQFSDRKGMYPLHC